MSINQSPSVLKKLRPIALSALAFTLLSPLASAATYTLTGGLTKVHSTTFNTDVAVSPNPSGIDAGSVEVNVNTGTRAVTFQSGADIDLSTFAGSISFIGTTTTFNADADLLTNVGVSGKMNSSRRVIMTSANAAPAVDVDTQFSNCSGIACGLLGAVDLNSVHYTVDITFNASFSQFTGTLVGTTSNGSTMHLKITGTRR